MREYIIIITILGAVVLAVYYIKKYTKMGAFTEEEKEQMKANVGSLIEEVKVDNRKKNKEEDDDE